MHAEACELNYRTRQHGEDWTDVREWIRLDRTPAGFNGFRRWFLCPRCDRCCRVLYGGQRFWCRSCRGAVYQSQYDLFCHASHERARRIRLKLGQKSGNIWDGAPPKPKGMHWQTYWRLVGQIYAEQNKLNRSMFAIMKRRGWLNEPFDGDVV